MSLSARCPVCATRFKVVPDQLKVSDGWVRCGQCGEVFDAHVPVASAPSDASELTASASENDMAVSAAGSIAEPGEVLPSKSAFIDQSPMAAAPLETASSLPEHDRAVDVLQEVVPVEAPAIGFLANIDPAQRRRKARARRGMGLAALLLAVLLGVQVAYFQRDRLAASAPALQPALVALCELAHCTLAPVRQIESVALDSSTFTQLRPDAFRLSFVLRNEAQIALALPALEVTLTDNQDRAVVRRVVFPADFAPQDQPLAARSELAGSLVLGVAADAAEPRSSGITGYRVLAFYP